MINLEKLLLIVVVLKLINVAAAVNLKFLEGDFKQWQGNDDILFE